MSAQEQPLPADWTAEWNQEYERYLFIDTTSGHTQWDPPTPEDARTDATTSVAAQAPRPARRQYAAGQTQAYSGDATAQTGGYNAADPSGQAGGQLFTPGLEGDNQFAAQQQQQPQGQFFSPVAQPVAYGTSGPDYGQRSSYSNSGVDQLASQFSSMNVQSQKGFSLQNINLLTTPPEPAELHRPPPEIRLPPGACISTSPFALPDPSYQRCTLNAIPTTNSLLGKSKMPLALVLTPYRSVPEGEPEVPVVADQVIARCRRCRTYINPYVQFIDNGNRWKCCMCTMSNEIPQLFDWDAINNQPGDRWSRPELNHGVVDFVAPTEYMVRPPPPYTVVFVIDISHAAVQSGMVAVASRTILDNLDLIPNANNRTKIAFIAVDTAVHFFSIPTDGRDASILAVPDLDDIYLPRPTDLLVNLTEAKASVENLLGRFPELFADNTTIGSALGPALQAAFKMISGTGGKVFVLTASIPSIGAGELKNREDARLMGTPKESALLQQGSPFYKNTAVECSRTQVSIDMFLFGSQYMDIASLSILPHYTSGQTYFYPGFNAARPGDATKFAHEFGQVVVMPIMLEAVMRVRASRGLRMSAFYGNFFVRSTDLLAMPAVPQDQSYAIEMEIEETLTQPFVVMQTAVLHTTCFGERRIRVITSAVPTTSSMSEVFASADQVAMATLFANKAVERSLSHKLEDAREALHNKTVEILTAYKTSMTAGGAGASAQLAIADNMRMFPVLMLGLLKSIGIRQSSQVPLDMRAYSQALLTSLPAQLLMPYLYPMFYSLHNMPPEAGTAGEYGVILPPAQPLTSERLERHGLFLIEDGQNMYMWIGRDAVPQLIQDVFNIPSYDVLPAGKTALPELDNDFSQRVNAVIQGIRGLRRGVYWPDLYIVKEDGDPSLRQRALSCLIQDRADALPSYQQFLDQIRYKVNGSGY